MSNEMGNAPPESVIALQKQFFALLRDVHTPEQLAVAKISVEELRQRALKECPEYRQFLVERQAEAEARAAEQRRRAEVLAVKASADANVKAENAERRAARRGISPSKGLLCPKCGSLILNWRVSGRGKRKIKVPWCFSCNVKMVAQGDKHYIRALRPDQAMADALKRVNGLPLEGRTHW